MIRPLLAVLLIGGLAACGSDGGGGDDAAAAGPAPTVVTINTFDFQPDPLTVAAGTTVTFENQDSINHSVTPGTREAPEPDLFAEGVMAEKGATYELTLEEPGTYAYFCKFHPGEGMTAEITVE
jgi:plastocyanin